MKNTKFCPAMWLSGFFGLGALVHGVRSIAGFSLVVGGSEISLGTSLILAFVLGALSVGLLMAALKRPCGGAQGSGKEEKGTCCGL